MAPRLNFIMEITDKKPSRAYTKLIPSLLADGRHKDVGLSDEEGKSVLFLCSKFANKRDHLDDLYQTALLSIYSAFQSTPEIRYRKGFINTVVNNSMCCNIVRKNNKDLIYKCLNLFEAIDHTHCHIKDRTWIKFRYV